jgi:predicted metal-binding membrane protein
VVPLLVAAVLVAVVFPIVFLPWSRTLWTAIDLRMRPLEPGEAPGLEGGRP